MRKLLVAMMCVFALCVNAQTSVTINTGNRLQTVEGWGVSLCWWAAQAGQWDDESIAQIADWLVSPDGLNYNVFRYNIPGGDAPGHDHMSVANNGKGLRTRMAGFAETEADFTNKTYKWKNDEAQIKMLRAIIARAKHYGKENQLMIEAFANTPPYWMTKSGCASGASTATDTNLPESNYEVFAEYLIDVCKHFKDVEGIEFYTLAPFNEPNTDYWKQNGNQEGCGFKPADQVKFIPVLYSKLMASGLNTVISASDETNEKLSKETWDVYAKSANIAAMNAITQWNSHSYGYDPGGISDAIKRNNRNKNRASLRDAVAAQGKRLWMSETGAGGSGIDGNLKLAQTLWDDIKYLQPVVWCDWQAMETNDQWCFLTCNGEGPENMDKNDKYIKPVYRNKNYYLRSQVTGKIKVGYVFVETSADNILAAVNPSNDEMVVCLLNTNTSLATYDLNLSSWGKSSVRVKSATITDYSRNMADYSVALTSNVIVPKQSIVTLVLEEGEQTQTVPMTDSEGEPIEFGGKYIISTTTKEKDPNSWITKYIYPDYLFFASGAANVSSQKDWNLTETYGGFVNNKYAWEIVQTSASQVSLKNKFNDKYLAGDTPDLCGVSISEARKFKPYGPYKIKNLDNINNFWVLEAETGRENKYLNWNGNTVGNGFCFWKEGKENYGSNFRFHRLEQATIRNIYIEEEGERFLATGRGYKVNGDDNLEFTEPHDFYQMSVNFKMEGTFTSIEPATELDGYVGNRYIVNGVEQDAMYKPEYIRDGDVVDVVFVCQGETRTETDMTEFVHIKAGDDYLRATAEGLSVGSDDKYSIFLVENRPDGTKHLLSYGEGLYMNMASVAAVGQDGNRITFSGGDNDLKAVKSGLDYLVVDGNRVSSQQVMPEANFMIEMVESLPVKLNDVSGKGYGTFYAPVDVVIPEGLEAYTATLDGDALRLTKVDGVIPAATGVILYTETAVMSYSLPINGLSTAGDTDLDGTYPRMYVDGNIYGLNQKNGKVGFYKMRESSKLSPFRAFLRMPEDGEAKELSFDFSETDIVEAIEMWHQENTIYDLQGRRVRNPGTGLYIVNGKKILIRK